MANTRLHFRHLIRRYMRYKASRGSQPGSKVMRECAVITKIASEEMLNSTLKRFTPKRLENLQDLMIQAGWNYATVNARIKRVIRMFEWAVVEGYTPAEVPYALTCLPSISRNDTRCKSRGKPRLPVAWEHVERLLPFMRQQIRDMIIVQSNTGMRPGDLTSMKPCEIDTSLESKEGVWIYRPGQHKTEYRGAERMIVLGPVSIELIKKYIRWEQPQIGIWRVHLNRRRAMNSYHYYGAINTAHNRAERLGVKIERWTPYQIRHATAHRIDSKYGRETEAAVLGHSLQTSNIYVKRNMELAILCAKECG